jgi:hypothetical protein
MSFGDLAPEAYFGTLHDAGMKTGAEIALAESGGGVSIRSDRSNDHIGVPCLSSPFGHAPITP